MLSLGAALAACEKKADENQPAAPAAAPAAPAAAPAAAPEAPAAAPAAPAAEAPKAEEKKAG